MIRNSFRVLATSTLAVLLVAASPALFAQSQPAANDHQALAGYYSAQAQGYAAQAAQHSEMLAAYKANVTRTNNKNQATTIGHCETLVQEFQQKAAAAQKLAAAQQELASVEQPASPQSMAGMQGSKADPAAPPSTKPDDMAGMKMCCGDKSAAKANEMPGMDMSASSAAKPASGDKKDDCCGKMK